MATQQRFSLLRTLLREQGLEHEYVAEMIGCSKTYFSYKICAKVPFDQQEQYIIMDLVHWPHERMHELFPKDGLGTVRDKLISREKPALRALL